MGFKIFDLGLTGYQEAWSLQKEMHQAVRNKFYPAGLLICRHHPVFTLGRLSKESNILASEADLIARGIEVHRTERGGDVTYHGPGQLTLYPVVDLSRFRKDIHLFLRCLERTVIELLGGFGIEGKRLPGLTGAWVGKEKIASIGIAIKNWVTFHGLSINIKADDLDNYRLIRPCGMDIKMTSLETLLGRKIQVEEAKQRMVNIMEEVIWSK